MKTQRIKIYGIIDSDGSYNASGWTHAEGHKDCPWIADGMPDDSDKLTWRKFIIEASVPIPEQTATLIEGRVTQ